MKKISVIIAVAAVAMVFGVTACEKPAPAPKPAEQTAPTATAPTATAPAAAPAAPAAPAHK